MQVTLLTTWNRWVKKLVVAVIECISSNHLSINLASAFNCCETCFMCVLCFSAEPCIMTICIACTIRYPPCRIIRKLETGSWIKLSRWPRTFLTWHALGTTNKLGKVPDAPLNNICHHLKASSQWFSWFFLIRISYSINPDFLQQIWFTRIKYAADIGEIPKLPTITKLKRTRFSSERGIPRCSKKGNM